MHGVAARLLAVGALVAVLDACELDGGAGSAAGTVDRALPPLPARPPIESGHLPNDIYEAVCRLGAPVLVRGWSADPDTRFVYFQGPFSRRDDPEIREFLYMSLPGPGRRWVSSRRWLDRDEIDVDAELPGELARYQLTRVETIKPNIHLVRLDLGDPVLVRDVGSGRQRYIFDQKICLGEHLLEGMYLDVEREHVVKARGIEHPRELKWVLSDGRPPAPDSRPTYYLDVPPEIGSPQSVALAFIRRRESQDPEAARQLLWEEESQRSDALAMLEATRPGMRIDDAGLTYETTRYGREEAHITIRYSLYDDPEAALAVEDRLVLRKQGKSWRVVDSRRF